MDIEQLKRLAQYDFSNFVDNENNVKLEIVIPFLRAFNLRDFKLEHAAQGSRIDINIGNKIIVETKALNQKIDNPSHISQLDQYCWRERPILAILTNGKHYRIYSPLWMEQRTFSETIIFEFYLTDLANKDLIERLEKILGFTNYESGEFIEHIQLRQKEILKIKSEIEELKHLKRNEVADVKNEIDELKEQIKTLGEQIKLKEKFVSEVEQGKIPEIQTLASDYFIPFLIAKSTVFTPTPTNRSSQTPHISNVSSKKVGKRLVINSPKIGVLAYGYLLENNDFVVESGSTISIRTANKFQTSARKAFELRKRYIDDGTINDNRQFTRDITFNSISQAASVLMGDSKNGNKEWVEA